MKIYHKRNFLYGLICILLALILTTLNIVIEFRVKTLVLSIISLSFGILLIIGSMSHELTKKDIINERDERNQLVNLKSRSKSFGITQGLSYALMLILFIAAKVTNDDVFHYIGLGFLFNIIISFIAEIFSKIYYEHRI